MKFPMLLCASAAMLSFLGCASIPDQSIASTPQSRDSGTFNFFAVGDTGYLGSDRTKSGISLVAKAVQNHCADANCQFGLMAGDNIYERGAAGDAGDAELFRTRFTEPYGSLQNLDDNFRLYIALGNHDWYTSRKGALAQVKFHETTRPFYMDGLFYSVKPAAMKGDLEVFVLDTEMLLAPHKLNRFEDGENGEQIPNGKTRAGGHKNALPVTGDEKQQLDWFNKALKNSTAKWKIVLAHHPLWQSRSGSKYEQSIKLRETLMPGLCQYADLYVAGHQHTQEVHTDNCGDASGAPLVHVVSGAGAKARKIEESFRKWQLGKYPQVSEQYTAGSIWGFSHFSIDDDKLKVNMVTVDDAGKANTAYSETFENRK